MKTNLKFLSHLSYCQRLLARRQITSWIKSGNLAETVPLQDVEKLFSDSQVQNILQKLTGVSFEKVFESRPQQEPENPVYKLMTDEELQTLRNEANKRASGRLQIPPFLNPREEGNQVICHDPEISGFDISKYVFTDITAEVSNEDRIVAVRQPDGLLRTATVEEKERMIRLYFHEEHLRIYLPEVFSEPHLSNALEVKRHIHILDWACLQLEPYDPTFVEISKTVFDHANKNYLFHLFWSTRHCGSFLFYLTINKDIDNYLLFLAKNRRIEEMRDVVLLYHLCYKDSKSAKLIKSEDTAMKVVQLYVAHDASKKGELELILQKLEEEQIIQEKIANL